MSNQNYTKKELERVPIKVLETLETSKWEMESLLNNFSTEIDTYQSHKRYYIAPGNPEIMWQGYTQAHPLEMWQGPLARLIVMYDSLSKNIYLKEFPQNLVIEPGQILFMHLDLHPIIRRSTTFQISEINKEELRIVFNYVKQNPTQGRQEITLSSLPAPKGDKTLISHKAWFKGPSKFFDRVLYPLFHSRVIDEFHKQIAANKGLILEKKGTARPDNPSIIT